MCPPVSMRLYVSHSNIKLLSNHKQKDSHVYLYSAFAIIGQSGTEKYSPNEFQTSWRNASMYFSTALRQRMHSGESINGPRLSTQSGLTKTIVSIRPPSVHHLCMNACSRTLQMNGAAQPKEFSGKANISIHSRFARIKSSRPRMHVYISSGLNFISRPSSSCTPSKMSSRSSAEQM